MNPDIPPYPETVTPDVVIPPLVGTLIQIGVLFAVMLAVLLVLRAAQRRNSTEPTRARNQTIIATGISVVVAFGLTTVVLGMIRDSALERAREANYNNIYSYNSTYAEAIHEVYGFDITFDEANVLLSGVELATAYPDGTPVTVVMVDEFEPQAGLQDYITGEPIPVLANDGDEG